MLQPLQPGCAEIVGSRFKGTEAIDMQVVISLLLAVSTLGPTKPKLIEWGGDSPSVADFRDHIDRIEANPFDGTVISVTGKNGDKPVDLGWRFWCKEPFKREFFTSQVND